MRKLVEIAGFQVTWFALVWGAANGRNWLGLIAAAAFLSAHLVSNRDRIGPQLVFLAESAAVGFLADSLLVLSGVISFPPQAQLGWPAPIWMTALWLCFAATFSGPLHWLAGNPRLVVVFGAVGGPLSYYAGSQIGAVILGPANPIVLLLIAGEWALAMPVLLMFSRLSHFSRPRPTEVCS